MRSKDGDSPNRDPANLSGKFCIWTLMFQNFEPHNHINSTTAKSRKPLRKRHIPLVLAYLGSMKTTSQSDCVNNVHLIPHNFINFYQLLDNFWTLIKIPFVVLTVLKNVLPYNQGLRVVLLCELQRRWAVADRPFYSSPGWWVGCLQTTQSRRLNPSPTSFSNPRNRCVQLFRISQ